MTDTVSEVLTDVKADLEALAGQIKGFFEHLRLHTHPDNHPALANAENSVIAAVATPVPTVPAEPAVNTEVSAPSDTAA